MGSILGSGRSPGGGDKFLMALQYSCPENLTDRGAWWATVHGVAKESDRTERPKQQQKQSPSLKYDPKLFLAFVPNL